MTGRRSGPFLSLLFLAAAASATIASAAPAASAPTTSTAAAPGSPSRLVLRTIAGDLLLSLDPTLAPRHVRQLIQLARLGVFDSTHFYRVDPSFLVQLSSAYDRTSPLTPKQKAAIHPLGLELSPARHLRGVLTMAHEDGAPDSAETSFSILLADSPHLDGKYTIFGRLEEGWEVLDQLVSVPRDFSHRPVVRLGIRRAEPIEPGEPFDPDSLAPARPVAVPEAAKAAVELPGATPLSRAAAAGVLLMTALALAGFALSNRLPPRALGAIFLMIVLVGAFLAMTLLTPEARTRSWLGGVLFVALLATIRLMGRLEPPA